MNPRIHPMLAFVVGLIAFSILSVCPAGPAAAATPSGIILQKTDGTPEVWFMDSTGLAMGFAFGLPTPTSGWKIVGVGDFNGDGYPDILWRNSDDGTPAIWFLNGTNIVQMTVLPNPGTSWKIVGVGDFNGDGYADILWQATDATPSIWLMSGATPLTYATLANPGSGWKIVGVGDFNGDGKADILWQYTDGTPGMWLMNGTTPTTYATLTNPGSSGWKIVGVGDFNGDGRSDILWQYTDAIPGLWLMNGTSYISQVGLTNPGAGWKIVGAGDFNGDGKSDILWQNSNDGTPAVWLMNGVTPIQMAPLRNPGTNWQVLLAGSFGVAPPIPVQANDGHIQITTVGGAQTVFNHTTDSCGPLDSPDTSAHAFRSADGTVNLTGNTGYFNYRAIGPTLDSVQRSCAGVYSAAFDPTFSRFENAETLYFGYTPDNGRTVYGLVHNEWYPWLLNPPLCSGSTASVGAAATTLLVSTDAGATYAHPQSYQVAVPTEPWSSSFSCSTLYGQWNVSNIIARNDGYYYALYTSFSPPDGSGTTGNCIMRTANLADALSWQTWIGSWQQLSSTPQCVSLPGIGTFTGPVPESVKYSTYLNAYVLIMIDNYASKTYSTSSDLLNWSQPQTILALTQGQANGLTLMYGSVLDPTDTTFNFDTITQQPYLYLVYVKPSGERDIIRQQIRFTLLN
jgi:hypothetical protein